MHYENSTTMKQIKRLPRLLLCIALSVQFASCGLLDFEFDEDGLKVAAEMKLNYDTVYAMRGDTLLLVPVFEPDTVNIPGLFIRSTNTSVVTVGSKNRLDAVGVGHAKLYIESVSARLSDSVMVYVMEPWQANTQVYPYETVYYTEVTVDGKPMTEDMVVAAFVGDECRAIGQALTFHGFPLVQFRVGSEEFYEAGDSIWTVDPGEEEDPDVVDDGEEDDEEEIVDDGEEGDEEVGEDDEDEVVPDSGHWVYPYREQISFRCYDRRRHILYILSQMGDLDGEAHGRLSELYPLAFRRK